MSQLELLRPHAKRPIRAFLRDNSPSPAEDAFWSLVYGRTVVNHATAVAVERELSSSSRTVGELVEGWRPEALKVPA